MSRIALLLAFVFVSSTSHPQVPDTETAIRTVLTAQLEAWNRGDIQTFMNTYAEDCTFVGRQILQGRAKLLARYQRNYPTLASMGKLSFENLMIRQLDDHIATAVGAWHIERPPSFGGPVGGVFSLILQVRDQKWQIMLDHTS